jgi:chitodextrinase
MATTAYEKQVVLLDNYKGAAKYIGFRTDYELSEKAGGGFYIDDIIIELIPTCSKPDYFEFGGKTDKTLSFSFVHPGALKYEVKYGAKDFDVETEGSVVELEGTNFVLTGLTAETEYDVYVRAICSETDSSPWSFAGSYTTTAEPIASFPYEFNFDDAAETAKWRFAQDGQPNQWFIGIDTANVVADRLNNTDKGLYISKDGGLTANYREKVNENSVNATSYSWAYRTINLEPGVYTISYDWTCYGEFSTSPSDYARVGLLPAVSTFAAGTNKIANYDGSSTNLNATTMPKDWFDLSEHVVYSTSSSTSNYYRLCGIDSTKALNEQWKTVTETIVVTEELAGTYNMLFYWSNNNATSTSSGYSGYYTERGAVIDNLSIVKYTCNKPMYLQLGEYDYQSAEITWSDLTVAPTAYNVKVVLAGVNPDEATADQIVFEKQVTEKSVKVAGLASNTSYSVYVQAVCSDTDKSIWSTPLEFTTVCTPQALDYVFNFDAEDGYYLPPYEASGTTANTTYKVPNCFKSLHAKGIQYKYSSSSTSNMVPLFPYLVKNTSTVITSRSGDYALKFAYTGSASYKTDSIGSGGMIVFPLFEGDLEDLQISFWMRSIQHNKSTQKLTVTGIGTKYARKITVGTMTNPDDPSTFVALDTVVYPYEYNSLKSTNLISEDPSGNDYWVEAIVPLAGATGKYIAFKNESYETALNQMFIDDVVISNAQSCLAPTEVEVASIRSTSAEVKCSHVGASKYVIEVATDADFSKDLKSYTTTSLPYKVEGLTPATSYNVRIQAVCSEEDASKWSMASTFVTATTMLFEQDFSNSSYCPDDWSRASSTKADDVFDNQAPFSMLNYTAISSTWYSEPAMFDEGMFSTRHISSDIISTNKGWLFSPCIELKENEKQHLVFDLALTAKGDNGPIALGDKDKTDDRFMVIISDDFGKTWKRENATIWGQSATDDYQLFSVPNTGEQVVIDLTKYAGKVIKVAFYVESNLELEGAKIEIHLDNVHINTYTESAISAGICQTENYEDAVFFIESSNLKVGTNEVKELSLSSKNNVSDVYYALAVEVTPMAEKVIEASICEGDVYSQNNFSGLTEAGVYKQKLPSASGCDSVVTLNLSVTSAVRTMTVDTICYGSSVEWNGVEYNRTGVYIDTLVSAVTGCDSIVTFVLNVKEAISAEAYVNICFGDTYTFGTQTISASGDYTETFETAKGCDSIVTLHATVLPDYRKTINATIVKGNRYNDNGFVGLSEAGTYTLPLKSKVGDCDSTITLNLRVVDDSTQVAVGNVSAMDLVLVPNPVKSGNTLYVNAEFTKEQTSGLVVEVFNAVGQRVYIDEPYIYPIEITGLIQRGVYLVRITTGDGKMYQSKVVVE